MTTSEDANHAPAVTTAAAMVPADPGPRMGAVVGQPYAESTTFSAGDVLEDRFKILRFIAQGGAGEVYEAHDLELRCPVALKVVRRQVAENERAIERFRREIALARQVTHPNVCRIFDVFRHELPPDRPGGEPVQSLFLTMELLVGESLAAHIHRHGPMDEEECLPLVEDMVAGLLAAHRAGVIHRDFKSANVMLARDATGLRAVVTDFGLARAQDPDDPNPLTHTGTVVGTPNYMAPEQLTGEEVGPGVDTYALGIVMYEMVTGKRPFRGETDLSTAVKRLTETPASPRVLSPALAPNWEEGILRCLERDPEDRFLQLDDLVEVLSGRRDIEPVPEPAPERQRSFWIAAGGIVAFVLLSALLLLSGLRGKADDGPLLIDTGGDRKPRIAVLLPRNLARDSETEWLSAALGEMMAVEMELPGDLEMLRPEDVEAIATSLDLDLDTALGRESVALLRRRLTADLILEGSYLARSDQDSLRLNLRIHGDTEPRIVTVEGLQSQLVDTVNEASTDVRNSLGLSESDQAQPATETDRLFQVSRIALQNGDLMAARQILQQIVDKSPDSLDGQVHLARTHHLLGDRGSARAAAVLATRLSRGADREQQLYSQGHLALIEENLAEAAELFLALHRFFPEEADYTFLLAETLMAANASDQSLLVLKDLTETKTPLIAARSSLLQARAAEQLGSEEGPGLAETAVLRAEAAGFGTLAAHARVLVAKQQIKAGELPLARETLLIAEGRYRDDQLGLPLAEVLSLRAEIERRLGGSAELVDSLLEEAAALRGARSGDTTPALLPPDAPVP